MEHRVNDALVHYVEHGSGVPIVALHGAGVDHRDIEAGIEAVVRREAHRRIYPDLPGMGGTTAEGLTSNDDVVDLLSDFIAEVAGEPVLLLGHSYGSYLARGVAARRPDLVRGLALLCPMGEGIGDKPEHGAVHQGDDAYDELDPELREGFEEYFVVRTAATARRYRDHSLPGTKVADEEAMGRIFGGWDIDLGSSAYDGPTLLVAGRRDATSGHAEATALLDRYPHAALLVVEDAGHALVHERPELLAALLGDWFDRAGPDEGG